MFWWWNIPSGPFCKDNDHHPGLRSNVSVLETSLSSERRINHDNLISESSLLQHRSRPPVAPSHCDDLHSDLCQRDEQGLTHVRTNISEGALSFRCGQSVSSTFCRYFQSVVSHLSNHFLEQHESLHTFKESFPWISWMFTWRRSSLDWGGHYDSSQKLFRWSIHVWNTHSSRPFRGPTYNHFSNFLKPRM